MKLLNMLLWVIEVLKDNKNVSDNSVSGVYRVPKLNQTVFDITNVTKLRFFELWYFIFDLTYVIFQSLISSCEDD